MKCVSCNKDNDCLERINAPEETGIFYCFKCFDDHLEAIKEIRSMSREDLDNVPYTLVKWRCQGKKCNNGTKVRDYGTWPWYYRPTTKGKWHHINSQFWSCGKHNKFYKRLVKAFGIQKVYDKIYDFKKQKITKI